MSFTNKILLVYLRYFPFNQGKKHLVKYLRIPDTANWIWYENPMKIKFYLDISEYQMKQIYSLGSFEKNTIYQLKKLINKLNKEGKIQVLDVGANIGFYSLTISRLLEKRDHLIHSFEPNPYTVDLLQKNLSANKSSTIVVNPYGLASGSGSFELIYNEKNLGTASIYSTINEKSKKVTISTTSIDEYCDSNEIDSVQIIKVDIEGGEMDFIKGAKKIIAASPQCIFIVEIVNENCLKAGYTADELFSAIIDLGFVAFLPKSFPFRMKKVHAVPRNYHDNIIFIKGL